MQLVFHHHHHHHYDALAGRIERELIGRIIARLEQIMATLEQTLAAVEAQTTEIDGLKTFVAGLKKQLDDALGGALTPSQQMRVDAIFNKVTDNTQAIDDAIKANTPAGGGDTGGSKIDSTVEVTSSANPSNVGDTLIFSASVAHTADHAVPTGTISFGIDGNAVGTGTLDADGVAVYTMSQSIPAGDHQLVATYAGDAAYNAAASTPLTLSVTAPANPGTDTGVQT
jgi:hypothetical protein